MRQCVDCGKELSINKKAVRCHKCEGRRRANAKPDVPCACGCGQPVPRRVKNGYPLLKYIPGHRKYARGPADSKWKGGRLVDSSGYVRIYVPEHREANRDGYVLEHRYVYEEHHGVVLQRNQTVHHINGNKTDNRVENLVVTSQADHARAHNTLYSREDLTAFLPEIIEEYNGWPSPMSLDRDRRFPSHNVWLRYFDTHSWKRVRELVASLA